MKKATKRKPPNRGRASQVPTDLAGLRGKLVMWRPRLSAEGTWVLCLCANSKFRYGRWDLQLIPVAGGGVTWAESQYVAPAESEALDLPALAHDLQIRWDQFQLEEEAYAEAG